MGSKVALKRVLDAKRWLRGNFTPKQLLGRLRYHAMRGWGTQYEDGFLRAHQTFRHHRVYCPKERRVRCLQPLPVATWQAHYDAAVAAGNVPASQLARWVKHGYHWPADAAGELDFVGPLLEPAVAQGIAEGRLHPETHEEFKVHVPGQLPAAGAAADGVAGGGTRAEKRARQTQLTGLFARQAGDASALIEARALKEAKDAGGSRSFSTGPSTEGGVVSAADPPFDSVAAAVLERLSFRKRSRPLAEDSLRGSSAAAGSGATSDFFPAVSASTAPPPCSPSQTPVATRPVISARSSSPGLSSHMLRSFLYDPSPAKQAPSKPQANVRQEDTHVQLALPSHATLGETPQPLKQQPISSSASCGKGGVGSNARRLLQRSQAKGSVAHEAAVRKHVKQVHSHHTGSEGAPLATPQARGGHGGGLSCLQAFAYTGSEPGRLAAAPSTQQSTVPSNSFSYSPLQPSSTFNRGLLAQAPRLADAMGAAKALTFDDSREEPSAPKRRPGAGLRRPS